MILLGAVVLFIWKLEQEIDERLASVIVLVGLLTRLNRFFSGLDGLCGLGPGLPA
jgi:hypothetical protein